MPEENQLERYIAHSVLLLWQSIPTNLDERYAITTDLSKYIKLILSKMSERVSMPVVYSCLYFIHKLSSKKHILENYSTVNIFLAGLIMADIATNDNSFDVGAWGKITMTPLTEISKLRTEVLVTLDFNLYVTKAEYDQWEELVNCQFKEIFLGLVKTHSHSSVIAKREIINLV
jgi:hypothetical protein